MSSLSRGGGEDWLGIKRKLHINRIMVKITNKNNNYRRQACSIIRLISWNMRIRLETGSRTAASKQINMIFVDLLPYATASATGPATKYLLSMQKASWPQKYNLVLTGRTGTDSSIKNYENVSPSTSSSFTNSISLGGFTWLLAFLLFVKKYSDFSANGQLGLEANHKCEGWVWGLNIFHDDRAGMRLFCH